VGGTLAATGIPTAQTFAYNPDNSLKTIGSVAVTNDNDGNITCMNGTCPGGVGSFAYDARGHLAQTIVAGPTTTDYGYDAFGRRIMLATSSGTQYFLYDGFNKVQDQPFPSGPKIDSLAGLGLDEDFMWGASEPPTYAGDSLLKDALGSTLALTDPSGNVLEYDSYEPYGNLTVLAGSYQGSDFQFTGRELNPADGLYYMRSRYYSPAIGRFISRDPAGLAGGMNLYAYAGDSPTNFTDPTGRDCWGFCGVEPNWGPNWPNPNPTGGGGGGGVDVGVGVPRFDFSGLTRIANFDGPDIQEGPHTNGGLGNPPLGGVIRIGDLIGPGPNWPTNRILPPHIPPKLGGPPAKVIPIRPWGWYEPWAPPSWGPYDVVPFIITPYIFYQWQGDLGMRPDNGDYSPYAN
jgi:RHS repeat-associated protein